VRVGVRGDVEVPLPVVLADPSPRDPAQVEQADPPMSEVVRAECWHRSARPGDLRAEAVAAEPWKTRRSGVRSSCGTRSRGDLVDTTFAKQADCEPDRRAMLQQRRLGHFDAALLLKAQVALAALGELRGGSDAASGIVVKLVDSRVPIS
jgi:hypothetical protein